MNLLQRAAVLEVVTVEEHQAHPTWHVVLHRDELLGDENTAAPVWDEVFALREVEQRTAVSEARRFLQLMRSREKDCLLVAAFGSDRAGSLGRPPVRTLCRLSRARTASSQAHFIRGIERVLERGTARHARSLGTPARQPRSIPFDRWPKATSRASGARSASNKLLSQMAGCRRPRRRSPAKMRVSASSFLTPDGCKAGGRSPIYQPPRSCRIRSPKSMSGCGKRKIFSKPTSPSNDLFWSRNPLRLLAAAGWIRSPRRLAPICETYLETLEAENGL